MIDFSQKHEDAAAYMPTPEEIAEGCAEIQKGWTVIEEQHRRGIRVKDEDRYPVRICSEGIQ